MKNLFVSLVIVASLLLSSCSSASETNTQSNDSSSNAMVTKESTTVATDDNSQKLLNPSEEYVISCLNNVGHVKKVEAATEDHDPNHNLHKQGGYTAAIYFTLIDIQIKNDPDGILDAVAIVKGEEIPVILDEGQSIDSPVDLGTDYGGQIEVYETVEEAQKRDKYLSEFDGTMFASGSHRVLGSMIIRISSNLQASDQYMLTDSIVEALENG